MNDKKKKMGRPKLERGALKKRILQIRLTDTEIDEFQRVAGELGQTPSEWARKVLHKSIKG